MQILANQKLNFQAPTIEDAPKLKSFLWNNEKIYSCEKTIVTFIMWNELYHHQIAIQSNTLFVRVGKEKPKFLLPFGDNMKYGVSQIQDYAAEIGVPVTFLAAEGSRLDAFKRLYEDGFNFKPSRDDYEYIYLREDLQNLSGKKFHSKRNHISSFSKQNDWSYESIDDSNIKEVLAMADKWRELHSDTDTAKSIGIENRSIRKVLQNREMLGVKGGLIRVDGDVIAFSFGSPINDMVFDVHVEKALPDFRTAYSVINREFVRHELSDYQYINREDDMGLEGLRKAKLSYQPYLILPRYVITTKE